MVFSSITFLFYFLPIFLALYFLLSALSIVKTGRIPRLAGNFFLLASSLFFYMWGEKQLVLIMLTSTTIDYFCGLAISGAWGRRRREPILPLNNSEIRSRGQKAALAVSVIANLSLLGYFKYADFFVKNIHSTASLLGLSTSLIPDAIQVALPMGISFYTFQSMSYTIDVYRGRVAATRSFIDFAGFVTMFPQLIAGPIIRFRDVSTQLRNRSVNLDDFGIGARRFMVGLGKKVIIADYLAVIVDQIFRIPGSNLTPGLAWLGAIGFSIQLYFDFSGYSDMAIGMGRMMGFHFQENFNYPFIARSLRDYWARWHITLGSWFRDYLYFPLGGGRRPLPRVLFNLFAVFFLCGLWHGASWTFVIWGLTHGIFLVLERQGLEKWIARLWVPLQHVYFLVVSIGIKVIFRSESLGRAGDMLLAMAGFARGDGTIHHAGLFLNPESIAVLGIGILGCTPIIPALNNRLNRLSTAVRGVPAGIFPGSVSLARALTLVAVFILSVMWMANETYQPFIYFRF